jgi:RNA polymerase sigma-70 factor (ECF subfamily)
MKIRAAFEHLNANEKRVLELAYFEGFSQSEIAAKLQEPLGTVKSWMRSALNRLHTAIDVGANK